MFGLAAWAATRPVVAKASVPAAPASRLRRDSCARNDIGFSLFGAAKTQGLRKHKECEKTGRASAHFESRFACMFFVCWLIAPALARLRGACGRLLAFARMPLLGVRPA